MTKSEKIERYHKACAWKASASLAVATYRKKMDAAQKEYETASNQADSLKKEIVDEAD